MTTGSHGARFDRSQTAGDGRTLALVMAGAGGSGLLALATLISGGGVLAAFLVYVLGASVLVPSLAVAPFAGRRLAAVARQRAAGLGLSGQPS